MYGQLSKIAIVIVATFIATSMPNYINSSVEGFVPSEETVNKNLHIDTASISSQVSFFDIDNEVTTEDLQDDREEGNEVERKDAYNEKSGKVLGEVSDKAIKNDNPIVSCDDPEAECYLIPTTTSRPTETPVKTPTPTVTRAPEIPTPTKIPEPTVTIILLPSKQPTFYPCPPVPIEKEDPEIGIPCVY